MKDINKTAQTKTFIFPLSDAETGHADEVVNAFCRTHGAASIMFATINQCLVYRVFYYI